MIEKIKPHFNKGRHHTEATKQKLREKALLQYKNGMSDIERQNRVKANVHYWLGKKRLDMVGKQYNLGRKASNETKEKMRKSQLGRKPTEETRRKLVLNALGRKMSEETKRKLREARLKQKMVYKDTSIERKIEAELKERSISYEKQVPLCKIAVVDFLLKEINTVIQADGCFWHGCPEHNPNYIKNKERDANQDRVLSVNGYKVVRFWEHEINKSVENCIEKIMK